MTGATVLPSDDGWEIEDDLTTEETITRMTPSIVFVAKAWDWQYRIQDWFKRNYKPRTEPVMDNTMANGMMIIGIIFIGIGLALVFPHQALYNEYMWWLVLSLIMMGTLIFLRGVMSKEKRL